MACDNNSSATSGQISRMGQTLSEIRLDIENLKDNNPRGLIWIVIALLVINLFWK